MVCLRNICINTLHKGYDDDDDMMMMMMMMIMEIMMMMIIIIYNYLIPKEQKGNYRKQPYWALHTYFGKC